MVGVLGTALSAEQIESMARLLDSKRVVLCLDGDKAGVAAAEQEDALPPP